MDKIKQLFKFEWMSKKFLMRVMIVLGITTHVLRLFGVSTISDTLLLGLWAHIGSLIGLNVWNKKKVEDNR